MVFNNSCIVSRRLFLFQTFWETFFQNNHHRYTYEYSQQIRYHRSRFPGTGFHNRVVPCQTATAQDLRQLMD